MRAAVALWNIIGEAQNRFVIAVIPPQGQFDADIIRLGPECDRRVNQRRFMAVEILRKGLQPAFIFQLNPFRLGATPVFQNDADTAVQKRQFAQAMLQRLKIELGHGKGFGRWMKRHMRAAVFGLADNGQIGLRLAMRKAHLV